MLGLGDASQKNRSFQAHEVAPLHASPETWHSLLALAHMHRSSFLVEVSAETSGDLTSQVGKKGSHDRLQMHHEQDIAMLVDAALTGMWTNMKGNMCARRDSRRAYFPRRQQRILGRVP
jgi:hypothetical protein